MPGPCCWQHPQLCPHGPPFPPPATAGLGTGPGGTALPKPLSGPRMPTHVVVRARALPWANAGAGMGAASSPALWGRDGPPTQSHTHMALAGFAQVTNCCCLNQRSCLGHLPSPQLIKEHRTELATGTFPLHHCQVHVTASHHASGMGSPSRVMM